MGLLKPELSTQVGVETKDEVFLRCSLSVGSKDEPLSYSIAMCLDLNNFFFLMVMEIEFWEKLQTFV